MFRSTRLTALLGLALFATAACGLIRQLERTGRELEATGKALQEAERSRKSLQDELGDLLRQAAPYLIAALGLLVMGLGLWVLAKRRKAARAAARACSTPPRVPGSS